MNLSVARSNILESMESGTGRILDRSRILATRDLNRAVHVAQQVGGDAAWETIVDGMSRLVYRMAEHYYMRWASHLPASTEFDDVFAAGLEGLKIAVDKYDPSKGTAFTTAAVWWIRNSVQLAVYSMIGVGRIPARYLKDGLDPTDAFVAAMSLDHQPDGERAMHESVAAPEPIAEDLEAVAEVLRVLRLVDPRLPDIATLLSQDHAMQEVADILGCSREHVRKLLGRGAAALATNPVRPGR